MQLPTVMVIAATTASTCQACDSSAAATGPTNWPLPSGGRARAMIRASTTTPATFGRVERTAALLGLVPS